jgi:hypothetical protein
MRVAAIVCEIEVAAIATPASTRMVQRMLLSSTMPMSNIYAAVADTGQQPRPQPPTC